MIYADEKRAEDAVQGVLRELTLIKEMTTPETRRKQTQVFSPQYRLTDFPESCAACYNVVKEAAGKRSMILMFGANVNGYNDFGYVVTDLPGIVECECECHQPGSAIMHVMPCCEGPCDGCQKGFRMGLDEHEAVCAKPVKRKARGG